MNAPIHPYEIALVKALKDRDDHGEKLRSARQHVLELEQRDRGLVALARQLLQEMPEKRQAEYLKKFPWLSDGPDPATRQAVLLATMQIFITEPTREFTTPEIEGLLAAWGIHANSKRVYNTLNYLAADGKLIRASRGRYRAGRVTIGDGTMPPYAEREMSQ